ASCTSSLRTGEALGFDEALEIFVAVARLELRGSGGGGASNIVGTGLRLAAFPVGQIGIRAALAGAHRGPVHGLLKTRRQLDLGGPGASLDDDRRGNVPPRDDGQRGHGRSPGGFARAFSRTPSSPKPVARYSNCRPIPSAIRRARVSASAEGFWPR